MRQAFATENHKENFIEKESNNSIYTCLKQLINTLKSSACKQLLEAVCTALLQGESAEKLFRRITKRRHSKTIYLNALSVEEAEKDIANIRQLRKLKNAHPLVPGARKLEQYHAEIMLLRSIKASYRDIQLWLLVKRRLKVSHHSVQRYLKAISGHKKQLVSHE